MRFLLYLLIAYLAYKFLKVIVGMFFTTRFDLKNKNFGSGFNFYSSSPKQKRNNTKPNQNPGDPKEPIDKKDIIEAEFEEIKENEDKSK